MISAIPRIFRGCCAPRGAEKSWQKAAAGPCLWKASKPRGSFPYLYASDIFYEERPYRVEHREYHDADIREYREPHVGEAERAERKAYQLYADGEDYVLPYDAEAFARDFDGLRYFHRVVVHEHHVRRLYRRVGAHRAHRYSDVGAAQDGRVVDAVAGEGQFFLLGFHLQQLFDLGDFVRGKQFRVNPVDAERRGDLVGDGLRVAREHHCLVYARGLERRYRLFRVRLDHVGDDYVPRVLAVHSHVDYRADGMTVDVGHAEPRHELRVARCDRHAVDLRRHALAAYFLNFGDARVVYRPAVCAAQALADRVRGVAFDERGVLYELRLRHLVVVDGVDFKDALRKRAGLVEYYYLRLRERLKVIRALDEHALSARAADASEERQRYADDERAGTAYDEEGQRAVNPRIPRGRQPHAERTHERRQHGERERRGADCGRVDAREFRDEVLRLRLARAGVLHKVENLRHRRFAEFFRRPHLQHARHVDAAADYLVALFHVARHALARQRARVEARRAIDHHAVDRHLLTRLHDDDAAYADLVRVYLLKRAAALDVRVVRADIHQLADVTAAFADGIALEPLAHLIEEHDRDGLRVISALRVKSERNRAHSRDSHQEALVEHLAVLDSLRRLYQNVVPDDEIRHEVERKTRPAARRREMQPDHQRESDDDTRQHPLLFLIHSPFPSSQAAPRAAVTDKSRSRPRLFCSSSKLPA